MEETQTQTSLHPLNLTGSNTCRPPLYAAPNISSLYKFFEKYIAPTAIWKYLPYVNIKKELLYATTALEIGLESV